MKIDDLQREATGQDVGDRFRLLLVDDEPRFREALSKRLEKRGAGVLEAADGAEALAVLEDHPVEIVVSDVKMPGMDGLALLRRLKDAWPDIEVILLTGHATTADGVEGIKAGAFDYLSKPIEFEQLLGKIRQAKEKIQRREERRRELEFREKVEQQMAAAERLAALGTLATGVAHEINNPLAIIREAAGWMGQILRKEEAQQMSRTPDLMRALEKIDASVERAKKITHQLLGFVQKNDAPGTAVDITLLLEESVQLVGREASNKSVDLRMNCGDAPAEVYTDPYQFRQVLLNLIANAIHATPEGGTVTLGSRMAGGKVVVTIEDTGEGIPKENLERIFEPFFTTKAPGKGTGLGLFVSRGIMARLGGTMSVESRLGKGTVFTLSLPVRPPKAATEAR